MKYIITIMLLLSANAVTADQVRIIDATATKTAANQYAFSVTLQHADTGWDHYANQWQVLSPDQTVLGTRTLYHPHVDEQPFTRSLSGVAISSGMKSVIIRARDSVHGVSSQEFTVNLP
jgi:hypothetical protein